MTENNDRSPHMVTLEDRSHLMVTGVSDVDSFDGTNVVAYTDFGQLTIRGDNLNIKSLSVESGVLDVEGIVTALIYTENRPRESFVKRLFR